MWSVIKMEYDDKGGTRMRLLFRTLFNKKIKEPIEESVLCDDCHRVHVGNTYYPDNDLKEILGLLPVTCLRCTLKRNEDLSKLITQISELYNLSRDKVIKIAHTMVASGGDYYLMYITLNTLKEVKQ